MTRTRALVLASLLWCFAAAPALAQSAPGWTFGYVPTVAQWNAIFAGKQDYLGAPPLLTTGGTMVGPLVTAPSVAGTAGLNVPPGTAPTSPAAGDVWTDASGIYSRINGVTYNLISPASTCPACALTNVANVFTAAVQTVQGATTTSPGWYAQLTGDTVARVRVGLNATDVPSVAFGPGGASRDTFIERVAVGNLRFGAPDAASPVAQISSVQNVVAGTSNTAGANRTYAGSQGTGTGVGGDIVFQTAPAGGSGTAQNALANAAVIKGSGAFQIVNSLAIGGATIGGNALAVTGTALFNSGVTVSSSFTATGLVTLADLATGSQDTVLGYWGSTAASALAINNCSNALIYSTTTHTFGCNATAGTGTVTTTGSPLANQTAVFTGATAITGVTNGSTGQSLHANTGAAPTYQSGGWVLLNTLTASNSATLSDTTSLTSTYAEYEIVLEDIVSATNTVSCELQVHSGGAFQTTGYFSAYLLGNGSVTSSGNSTTFLHCAASASISSTNPSTTVLRINNPSSAIIHPWNGYYNSYICTTTCTGTVGGVWNTAAAIDGFQVLLSSGNITSGKVKIYGRL